MVDLEPGAKLSEQALDLCMQETGTLLLRLRIDNSSEVTMADIKTCELANNNNGTFAMELQEDLHGVGPRVSHVVGRMAPGHTDRLPHLR